MAGTMDSFNELFDAEVQDSDLFAAERVGYIDPSLLTRAPSPAAAAAPQAQQPALQGTEALDQSDVSGSSSSYQTVAAENSGVPRHAQSMAGQQLHMPLWGAQGAFQAHGADDSTSGKPAQATEQAELPFSLDQIREFNETHSFDLPGQDLQGLDQQLDGMDLGGMPGASQDNPLQTDGSMGADLQQDPGMVPDSGMPSFQGAVDQVAEPAQQPYYPANILALPEIPDFTLNAPLVTNGRIVGHWDANLGDIWPLMGFGERVMATISHALARYRAEMPAVFVQQAQRAADAAAASSVADTAQTGRQRQQPAMHLNGATGFNVPGADYGVTFPAAGSVGLAGQQPLPPGPPTNVPPPPPQGGQAPASPPAPTGAAAGKGKSRGRKKAKTPPAKNGEQAPKPEKKARAPGASDRVDKHGFPTQHYADGTEVPANKRGQPHRYAQFLRLHKRRCKSFECNCPLREEFPDRLAVLHKQRYRRRHNNGDVTIVDGAFGDTAAGDVKLKDGQK